MTRHRRSRARGSDSQRFMHQFDHANALLARGQPAEARAILEELAHNHPQDIGTHVALSTVAYELQDAPLFLSASEQLTQLLPDDAAAMYQLAGAYLLNNRLALALQTYRRFLQRWPRHTEAATARQQVEALEASLGEVLADAGLEGDDALEIAAQHEQTQSLLQAGRYAEGRALAEHLLRRAPRFAPALNNLSLMYSLEGALDQATATAEQVLAFDPDNIHALANLTRFACLQGRIDQAKRWADQLKASPAQAVDRDTKLLEALSYLGDDQAIVANFKQAERASRREREPLPPLVLHLAAVATMRQGHEAEARRLWQKALHLAPGFELAQANVDDLSQPAAERHAPWPFSLEYWINRGLVEKLSALVQAASQRGETAITETIQQFVREHPRLVAVAPLLLDRGDPRGREFAMQLAVQTQDPQLLTALRDFAMGQRGPDQLRLEAARYAGEAGLMPKGLVRLWIEGEWRELMLLNVEIHQEPPPRHKPKVEKWLKQALTRLRRDDGTGAEPLLRQALAVEPDAPDLANNLAVAYTLQGREAEAKALLHANHQQHPDYVLGTVALARLHVRRNELEAARPLLDELLDLRRVHFEDFAALCGVYIEFHLADNSPDAARSWLDIWSSVNPEHPALAEYRRILRQRGSRQPAAPQRARQTARGARSTSVPAQSSEPDAVKQTVERAPNVPKQMRPIYDQIVELTDAFCRNHLDDEYAALSRKMAAALSRKRPSPLRQGRVQSWACAILYALGRVNFLFDRSQTPHLSATELCSRCGVSQATASPKAKQILDSLHVGLMDPQWSRRSLVEHNPMVWLLEVNGQIVDARDMPREVQQEAVRRGLIPYLPDAEE